MKDKSCLRDPHIIPSCRQKHHRLPWALERDLELGAEGDSPTLSCTYSTKRVCSVVLRGPEDALLLCLVLPQIHNSSQILFCIYYSSLVPGVKLYSITFYCAPMLILQRMGKKQKIFSVEISQCLQACLSDWHSSHKSFVRIIEQLWRRRSYLELFCPFQLILLNNYPLNTLLACFIQLFLSGTCIIL